MPEYDDAGVVRVRLIGAPAWTRAAREWQTLSDKDAALLAILAREHLMPRDDLARLLWPTASIESARGSLRQRRFRLHKAVGTELFTAGETVAAAPGVAFDIDAIATEPDDTLSDAPLLGTLDYSRSGDKLARWVRNARQWWEARRAEILEKHARTHERAGRLDRAISALNRVLEQDPLQEHVWRQLMHLHHRRGDRAAAVAAFESCERWLHSRLKLRPSVETLALLARIEAPALVLPAPPKLPPSLLRPPVLVGRAREWALMQAAWRDGRSFVLSGEAGIGKSRLLSDFVDARSDALVETARPGDNRVPYGLLSRVLAKATRLEGMHLDTHTRRELSRLLPELGEAPIAPGHDAAMLCAIDAVFAQARACGVHAVVVDDVQYADETTLRVLHRLATLSDGLVLGCATREVPARDPAGPLHDLLADPSRILPVSVGVLTASELCSLVETLALKQPAIDPAALGPALARHCGGNPLFALETLRNMLLHGGGATALPAPPSVDAVLDGRIAALSADALALARVAAISGADFDARLASLVLERPLLTLTDAWGELQAAHVLQGERFSHELMQDAVQRGIPDVLRAPLHGGVASALEEAGAPPERIAVHHEQAGDLPRAGTAALRAGAWAARLGLCGKELEHLTRAADCFERAALPRRAYEARLGSVKACLMHEGPDPAFAVAESLLAQASDDAERAGAQAELARISHWRGDMAAAVRHAGAAFRNPSASPDVARYAGARLAAALAACGQADEARQLIGRLVDSIDSVADPALRSTLWSVQGFVLVYDERRREALVALAKWRDEAERTGEVADLPLAHANMANPYYGLGMEVQALASAQTARDLYRTIGNPMPSRSNDANLAHMLIGMGQFAEALEILDGVLEYTGRVAADSILQFTVQDLKADALISLGQFDQAQALLAKDPPSGFPASRHASRLELRARIASLMGRADAESLWSCALAAAAKPGVSRMHRVRVLANASMGFPPPEAVRLCDTALTENLEREFPVGDLLATTRRAQAHARSANIDAALADVRHALSLHPAVRHFWMPVPELFGLAFRVFAADGLSVEARRCRQAGRTWLLETGGPHVPPAYRNGFLEHPIHRALLDDGRQPSR